MTTATVALGRARGSVLAGLTGFTLLSWAYLGLLANRAGDMSSVLAMPMTPAWSLTQAALMAVMWAVMMAAMMLPSAIPMVVAYDSLDGGTSDDRGGSTPLSSPGTSWCGRRSLSAQRHSSGFLRPWRSSTEWESSPRVGSPGRY